MRMRASAAVLLVVGIGILLGGCGRGTPPAITAQPKEQAACPGGSATFSVTATGTAPLSYQWRKDGTPITGATGATYTISSVAAANAGSYTVVVTNKAGSVTSAPAALTVNAPPTITAPPASQTACQGKSVLFSVSATGTAPLSYQWRKDGEAIPGATTAIYSIPAATRDHLGSYVVVVTNSCGSATSTAATLSLDTAPTITLQPTAQTVCAGHPVTLSVVAEGGSPLRYQWAKDGADIPGAVTAQHTIAAATPAEAGTYTVVVTNDCGTAVSQPSTLTVTSAPTITLHPVAQTAAAGDEVTFSVIATGTSPLTYQWAKDGVPIAGATSDLHRIPAAATDDAGAYTVTVSNACGAATSNAATLTVTPPVAPAPAPSPLAGGPFMAVNGNPVTHEAFAEIRGSILDYYARLYAQFGIDIRIFLVGARGRMFGLEIDLSALTSLLNRSLVEAEASRRGIVVSPEAIEAEFERQYQAMLDTYGITEDYLREYFAAQGGTLDAFKAEGRASVAEQLLYEEVQKSIAGPIELSEEELRKYFEAHKAEYGTEEAVEASHILVETKEEAQLVLDELASGADFAELARTRSKDPGSSRQGGQLGWFGRGRMVPAFEEAAFALKIGETSGIVETQFGFHIIRVTNRREATQPEFADVADRVRADATKEIAGERFDAWLKKAREEAQVSISDPILQAMYLKSRNIDDGIAALERIRTEGQVKEEYLSFIIGSLYEEKASLLESDIELLETQLPEGPEREAQIAPLEKAAAEARAAALAAYREALKDLPDDEDVKERIAALEGPGFTPR